MSLATRLHDARLGHGLQVGAAVALAYWISGAVGLPEGFWAVMSALIVTRPDVGATFAAGWDRVRGTALGTACGLAGIWLRHLGLDTTASTLAIVAGLACASAGVPLLRSAPITALIVLSSGSAVGHSAFQVAGLRVAEIAVGVAVGLALSVVWPAARAAQRFDADCARLLRRIAEQSGSLLGTRRSAAEKDAASRAMRAALRGLVLSADSAAGAARPAWRWRPSGPAKPAATVELPGPRRVAQLVTRTSQDVASLARVFDAQSAAAGADPDPLRARLRDGVAGALVGVARALERREPAESVEADASDAGTGAAAIALADLRRIDATLAERRKAGVDDFAWRLAVPLGWLLEDLRALVQVAAMSRTRRPQTPSPPASGRG